MGNEIGGIQYDRGLLARIDDLLAAADRQAFAQRSRSGGLGGDAGVDCLVPVGDEVLGKAEIDDLNIAVGKPALS